MHQPAIDPSVVGYIRSQDYRRFLAIQRAPAPTRAALYAVTAFYLELAHVAEAVSEPMLGAIRLAWWRENIEAIAAGHPPREHPVLQSIGAVLASGKIQPESLYTLIAERDADIDPSLLTDEARFLQYLDATAGTLHRLWCELLETEVEAEAVIALSRGYALIGLLLAIPYYARHNLLRLPPSLLVAHHLPPECAALAVPSAELRMLVHYLHEKAMLCLAHAGHYRLPPPLRVLLSIALYDAARLKEAAYDPYHPRLARRSTLPWIWRAVKA